ncbi:MAG: zinc ABC transporter substrate-binding protein [Planctomycetota bacterium]|nr:zinc ABC transporter substrate-binding protein [Planctomycetota bacterium]
MDARIYSARSAGRTGTVPSRVGSSPPARAAGPVAAPVLAAGLLLMICSRGQAGKTAGTGGRQIRVLCSFLPMYVFAANVVKDVPGIELSCLLPAGSGCPHGHSLSPGEMRRIAEAEVFVAHGMGLESFLGDSVRKANPHVRLIVASEGIKPLPSSTAVHRKQTTAGCEHVVTAGRSHSHKDGNRHGEEANGHGHEHEHEYEHGHGEEDGNPHAWVSLSAAQVEVRNIAAGLGKAMPEHGERFRKNAEVYCAKLAALREEFLRVVASSPNRKVVSAHDAFAYFAADVGLEVVALIEGSGGEGGGIPAGRMIEIVELIRREKPAAIFYEPGHFRKEAETIGRETGVPVYCLDPVASGEPVPDAYENAMRKNLETLKTALAARSSPAEDAGR